MTYAVIAYLLTSLPSATLLPLPEGEGWGEGENALVSTSLNTGFR